MKLALEPGTVETMFPKWTGCPVHSGVRAPLTLCSGAIDAVALVDALSIDHGVVVGLGMRPAAKCTALALGVALAGVVAPSHTPSAHNRTRVGLGALNAAILPGDQDKFADESTGCGARRGIVYVNPCDA